MRDSQLPRLAAIGLVIGALFGMAGTFVPTASLRSLLWGIDGTALVVAGALLTVHHVRRGNELASAGFLVFTLGEGLIVSSAAMDLVAGAPVFGAGVGLWAAALALVSASRIMPMLVRGVGALAAVLFTVGAVRIFLGHALTPLSQPLPFFAYPFLAATLLGWAWVHVRGEG